jgi:hypothetical protein
MLTEEKSLMAVYRRDGRRQPLRYAPMYLVGSTLDSVVERSEHRCPAGMDTDVHQSFLEPIREVSIHDEELATRRCSMMRIMAR